MNDDASSEAGAAADEGFMTRALALAERAAEVGEVPVGAVVVAGDGSVIGEGWNRPIADHDPTAHAEIVAVRDAARRRAAYRLPDATLYVTLEPCPMCVGALVHARVRRVVFGAADPKTGACGGALALHEHASHNHRLQVDGGVMADACGERLQRFFRARRAASRPAVRLVRLTLENAHGYEGVAVGEGQGAFVSDAPTLMRHHFREGYAEALYGIEAGGRPVGLMALVPPAQGVDYPGRRGDEAWLEGLRIDRRHQGRGVATRALRGIVAIAARRYRWLSLTVNLRNDQAEAAYRRFGFRDTGALYHGGPAGPQRILTLPLDTEEENGEGT